MKGVYLDVNINLDVDIVFTMSVHPSQSL